MLSYYLEAVIARESVARRFAAELRSAHVITSRAIA